ncbi:hypothetical protein [Clostridium tyrobutyricum]|uniref:lysine 5,6-aminomutase reactivase ATPase KamC n=1 Tax=Clostridium tyrobutyricum TaxID=1519 RepID=UPI0030D44556
MNYLNKNIMEKIGLYYVLNHLSTSSVYGRHMLHNLNFISEKQKLLVEYNNIKKCMPLVKKNKFFNNFTDLLAKFKDLTNTFIKSKNGKILDEIELYEIKYFIKLCIALKQLLEKYDFQIKEIVMYDFSHIYKLLNPLNSETSSFYIYDEYSQKLREIRYMRKKYDRNIFKEKDTEKQKEMFEKRQQIISMEKDEELNIRKLLSSHISKYADKFLNQIFSIGNIDFLMARSKLALDYNMCCPRICNQIKISMNKGINPMVKAEVVKRGGKFFPVSIEVSSGSTIITGANMGGKTVLLSTIALNYIIASMGFYVFANDFEFALLDFVYFLYEDSESIKNGLSTFGGEILELKKILNMIKSENGLVILDEFARGTNPVEGTNIIKALLSYINDFSSIFIMSTHYDGVCSFAKRHYQIKGLKYVDFNMLKKNVKSELECLNIINDFMDYTLELVDKNTRVPRDAVNICLLMGIDEKIIDTAKKLYDKEDEGET